MSNSATLWTIAHQAPLSMGFSSQEYWRGLPYPPPAGLPNPRIKPVSLTSPALAGRFFTASATWEAHYKAIFNQNSMILAEKRHMDQWNRIDSPEISAYRY